MRLIARVNQIKADRNSKPWYAREPGPGTLSSPHERMAEQHLSWESGKHWEKSDAGYPRAKHFAELSPMRLVVPSWRRSQIPHMETFVAVATQREEYFALSQVCGEPPFAEVEIGVVLSVEAAMFDLDKVPSKRVA